MNIAVLSHEIKIKDAPANGKEAYNSVVNQLQSEIADRQKLLNELSVPTVKCEIIKQWTPNKRSVTITVYEK